MLRFSKMAALLLGTMPASSRKRFTEAEDLCLFWEIVGHNPFAALQRWADILSPILRVVGSESVYAVFCVRFYFISAKFSAPHHGWWWEKLAVPSAVQTAPEATAASSTIVFRAKHPCERNGSELCAAIGGPRRTSSLLKVEFGRVHGNRKLKLGTVPTLFKYKEPQRPPIESEALAKRRRAE
ncbi:hypothetical protein HPB47_003512, partial [Ixodes persulcatus]